LLKQITTISRGKMSARHIGMRLPHGSFHAQDRAARVRFLPR
jgi:hypothetical protein